MRSFPFFSVVCFLLSGFAQRYVWLSQCKGFEGTWSFCDFGEDSGVTGRLRAFLSLSVLVSSTWVAMVEHSPVKAML